MDHLPLPQDPVLGSLSIPFLCAEGYDDGDFKTFPTRKRWIVERQPSSLYFTYDGHPVDDLAQIGGFLQCWLYFGLLREFLGKPVDFSRFKRQTKNDETLFTSEHLEELVSSWTVEVLEQDWSMYEKNLQSWKNHLYSCLLETRDLVLRIVDGLDGQHENVLSLVCLSIAVLGEYLNQTLKDIFIKRALESPVMQKWRVINRADCGQPLVRIMLRHGWCPNKVAYLDSEDYLSIGKLWYVANFEPPKAQEHHGDCTAAQCQRLQVDLQSYKTVHSPKNCACAFHGPQPDLLAKAVGSDELPLVTVSEDVQAGLTVDLQVASPNTGYIAISHVWADGMGNLNDNSLPQCLLRQLRDGVDALAEHHGSQSFPFWIDTLCLPRHPFDLRRKGLVTFGEAFKRAKHVLVLDSYLRNLPCESLKPMEIIARVATCGWAQRLWTFSEGRLASSIFFQFRDRSVDLSQVVDQWRDTFFRIPSLPSHGVDLAILGNYSATKIYPGEEFDRRLTELPTLRFALSARSTSWAPDEALCLGGILGLDMRKIVQATDAEKMRVVWSLIQWLPAGLTFSRASRKLADKGYRWAPASLMGDLDVQRWGGPGPLFARLDASPSEAGLVVGFPAVLFKASREGYSPIAKSNFITHCLSRSAQGEAHLRLQGRENLWYSCALGDRWHQLSSEMDLSKQVPAIILESPVVFGKTSATNDFQPMDVMRGLLVTYPESETGNDIIHAKAHRHVEFLVLSKKMQELNNGIIACCEDVIPRNMETIASIQDNPDALTQKLISWVGEYARANGLLQLGKEILRYQKQEVVTDGAVIKDIVWWVGYFCRIDTWYEVEEVLEKLTWCID